MNRNLLAVLPLAALLLTSGLATRALAHGDEPHGDHDAAHGGFVMMYQDLHFEVTAVAGGGVQLYFTDAARSELPAATVSDVAVEIESAGKAIETVTMSISAGGDFWEGPSKPVTDPDAIVRVGFLYAGKPLVLDVPASSLLQAENAPAADAAAPAAGHDGH